MSGPSVCSECGTENLPGAGFCERCAALLAVIQDPPDAFTNRPVGAPGSSAKPAVPPGAAVNHWRLVIAVGDARHVLAEGEDCLLGRSRQMQLSSVFRRFRDVSGLHLQVRAARGQAELTDQSSRHGTYLAGVRLVPHQPTALRLPAVIRLASNCYVALSTDLIQPAAEDQAVTA
jgi:hypothetical protein